MLRTIKFLNFWFPVILYSGIIFWISGLPSLQEPTGLAYFDKIWHVLEYVPLGFLFARAVAKGKSAGSGRQFLMWTALFVLVYGISDEIHQLFVVGRYADLADVLADFVGGVSGGGFFLMIRR